MKNHSIRLLGGLILLLVLFFFYLDRQGWGGQDGKAGENPALVEVTAELATLRRRLEALEARGNEPARAPTRVPRAAAPDPDLVARAVEAYLAGRKSPTGGEDKAPGGTRADLRGLLARLDTPGLAYEESEAIWEKLRQAGLIDKAVAAFKERAETSPNDPQAQCDYGAALLQKVRGMTSDLEKGKLAVAADKLFDRSLELDSQHWEARFLKATSLSFWPPIFGKTPEAIKHYRILMEQQEGRTVEAGQAQVYVLLGNLYSSRGDKEKARSTWRRGAKRHPTNPELEKLSR